MAFKKGDRVRLIEPGYGGIAAGTVGTVVNAQENFWKDGPSVEVQFDNEDLGHPYLELLEPYEEGQSETDWQIATEDEISTLRRLGVKFEARTTTEIRLID